jgi:hypothetical protein
MLVLSVFAQYSASTCEQMERLYLFRICIFVYVVVKLLLN